MRLVLRRGWRAATRSDNSYRLAGTEPIPHGCRGRPPGRDLRRSDQRLITRDHTFGSAKSPFDRVYVNDRPDEGIFGTGGVQAPLSPEVQAGIAETLREDFSFAFVEPKRTRRIADRIFAGGDDLDVLLTLGTIDAGPDERRVEVENRLYCGGLCGQAMTHVVELRHGEWAITGRTGRHLIY